MDAVNGQLKLLECVKNGGTKAMTRALNTAVRSMNTTAKKGIKGEYTIEKTSDAIKAIIVHRASYSNMTASLTSASRPIALAKFKYIPNESPGVKGSPTVFAKPKATSGGGYTGGFVARVGGHTGIFVRTARKKNLRNLKKVVSAFFKRKKLRKETITELYGPSGTEMLNNPVIKEKIEKIGSEKFMKEFDRQVDLLLKG